LLFGQYDTAMGGAVRDQGASRVHRRADGREAVNELLPLIRVCGLNNLRRRAFIDHDGHPTRKK
jgi:hypothetical protein